MIKERTTERLTRGQAGALLLSGVSAFLLTGARFGGWRFWLGACLPP